MNTACRPDDCANPPVSVPSLARARRSELIALFKALGDETRLEVFRMIAAQPDPICVCDITSQFPVSQPTISHHLKVLREAGLITVSRRGNWSFYAADPQARPMLECLPQSLGLGSLAAVP